jgi:hypothetical protein
MAINDAGQVAGFGYSGGDMHAFLWQPEPPPVTVAIFVKPGSAAPAEINLSAHGTVPVAILSSASFDATRIDPASVEFARAPIARKPNGAPMAAAEDVDGDGLPDLVLHFQTSALQLSGDGSTADVQLCGSTRDSTPIAGSTAVVGR